MTSKSLSEWEKEKGLIVREAKDTSKKMSEEEFNSIPIEEKVGVQHDVRVKFLKDNGYEVTRENMIDSSLSVKETK